MTKVMSLPQALKSCLSLILVLVVLYAGGSLSDHLVASQSVGMRWLGVAVAVGCLIPWLGVIILSLSHADEYHRRNVLVGTAAAFIVDLLVHTAFNVMLDAHLVSPSSFLPTLPVAMGVWVLSVGLTALYYYRASL